MTASDLPSAASPVVQDRRASPDDDNDNNLVRRLQAMTTAPPDTHPTSVLSSEATAALVADIAQQSIAKSSAWASSQHEAAEPPAQDTPAMGEANGLSRQPSNSSDEGSISSRRPSTPRAQTEPSPELLSTHYLRPRNRSPYSRSHLPSHSGSSTQSAPPMTRAHSLPTVISPVGNLSLSPSPTPAGRPTSPLRSPKRTRSPFRSQEETYTHSGAPSVCDISEDAELELTPNVGGTPALSSLYSTTGSLSRSGRRRPVSPLHQVMPFSAPTSAPNSAPPASTPTSTASSPLLAPAKFNESFPTHYSSSAASSSVPSTPTSMRSRSPSISSLETIPDSPDAEAEAIEAERACRAEAMAEGDKEGAEGVRRSSLDVPGSSGRALGFGKRDSRKRWSVCGAERRGDLDLETIWED